MTTLREAAEMAAEEYAIGQAQWCRCAGFTCSGCEAKTIKHASKDFIKGYLAGAREMRERAAKACENDLDGHMFAEHIRTIEVEEA